MDRLGQRILVIGEASSLLEGVSDLLELAGYDVALSSTWSEVEQAIDATPPSLAIIDLSRPQPDAVQLCSQIHRKGQSADMPILLLNFSSRDRTRYVELCGGIARERRLELYTQRLLGVDGLLQKVRDCLS